MYSAVTTKLGTCIMQVQCTGKPNSKWQLVLFYNDKCTHTHTHTK